MKLPIKNPHVIAELIYTMSKNFRSLPISLWSTNSDRTSYIINYRTIIII